MSNQSADTVDDLKTRLEDARDLADRLSLPLVAVFVEQALQNLDPPKLR